MVVPMSRPQPHPKTGVLRTRVAVPAALRPLLGKSELIKSLGSKSNSAEVRRAHAENLARFNAMIAAARDEVSGGLTRVSAREVAALAGEVYRQEVAAAEADPGSSAGREAALGGLLDQLTGEHGSGLEDERRYEPDAAAFEAARQFLRERGIAADRESVARMAVELWSARQAAAHVAVKRAAGDWSPDPDAVRFPATSPATALVASLPPAAGSPPVAPSSSAPSVKMADLLAAHAREAEQRQKTFDKRQAVMRGLERVLGHDDAARVGKAEVRAWKQDLLDRGKSLKTVADAVAMLRPVWRWGAANGLLPDGPNPFSGMAPKTPKKPAAPRVPFDDADAALILSAARQARGFRRWLPWVLAFTGCRIEEACGAARDDVREVRGVWCLDVHADRDGGGLKTAQSQRFIPLHPALIAEGFLAYVEALPKGSPLFPDLAVGHYGGRGETATKRLGRWVRDLGITDPQKAPAHSWRHRMKDSLRFLRVPAEAADAILGHDNPLNAGAGYGAGWRGRPEELLKELARVGSPLVGQP